MCCPFSRGSGSALTCRGRRTAARSGAGAFDAGALLSWLQQHAAFHFASPQQRCWRSAAARRTEQSVNAQTLRGSPENTRATTSHSAAHTRVIGFSVWQRTSSLSIAKLDSTQGTPMWDSIRRRVFSSVRKTRSTGPSGPNPLPRAARPNLPHLPRASSIPVPSWPCPCTRSRRWPSYADRLRNRPVALASTIATGCNQNGSRTRLRGLSFSGDPFAERSAEGESSNRPESPPVKATHTASVTNAAVCIWTVGNPCYQRQTRERRCDGYMSHLSPRTHDHEHERAAGGR